MTAPPATAIPLTPAALDEIERLADAVTVPGEWHCREMTHFGEPGTGYGSVHGGPRQGDCYCDYDQPGDSCVVATTFFADCQFIAHLHPARARALVAEVRKLRRLLSDALEAMEAD